MRTQIAIVLGLSTLDDLCQLGNFLRVGWDSLCPLSFFCICLGLTLAPWISNSLLSFSFLVLHNIPVYGYPIIHSPILSLGNIWAIMCLELLTIKLLLAFLYGNFSYTHILFVFGS